MFEAVMLTAFLEAAIRLGVPLALAALGETITERSGVMNIGLEGSVITGAFCGSLGALAFGSAGTGAVVGGLCGAAVGLVFAIFAIGLGTHQIITGTAITLGGLGFTAVAYQARFGVTGTALSLPTLDPVAIPLLSSIPILGQAFFNQAPTAYFCYTAAPVLWWFLFRTGWGLSLRAVGEDPTSSAAAGIPVRWVKVGATVFGGGMAGLAGAHLALAHSGTFAVNMSEGRGFIAIAVVVLGRWNPMAVLAAALFFGAASALQFVLQASSTGIPYQLFLALPYLLTLAALGGWVGKARAPAGLGQTWEGE